SMQNGSYTAKTFFEIQDEGLLSESSFGQAVNFFVGVDPTESGSADFNSDGNVDLVDFSILLFHWETDSPIADINGDGLVNIIDFSIMLFQWTG
ncbi:MAG: dockerin type I domain-containing protein, partial [Candidatus Spechtbacterales bacterium]